jgi:hypothetical protein
VLHLVDGEEGPFGVAESVVPTESHRDEVTLCLCGVGDGCELNVGRPGVCGFVIDPVSKVQ